MAVLVLVAIACSPRGTQRAREEVPFSDGASFEYHHADPLPLPHGVQHVLTAKVASAAGSCYEISWSSHLTAPGDRSVDTIVYSRVYDRSGRVIAEADGSDPGANRGRFTRLWLAPSNRYVGAQIELEDVFSRPAIVVGLARYSGRRVWILRVHRFTYAYDVDSGLLVRWSDGVRTREIEPDAPPQ